MDDRRDFVISEQRKHKRYRGVYAVYALTDRKKIDPKAHYAISFLRDFSLGGVSLFVNQQVPENNFVNVRLYDYRSKDPIEAAGNVVWKKRSDFGSSEGPQRYNIGVRFQKMSWKAKRRLKTMIKHFEEELVTDEYHLR